ncbi:MAG TPA: 50S ribosomal protein L11 methyltransferase [Methylomirabilota bacterium]
MLPKPADTAAAAYWEMTVSVGTDAAETSEAITNRLWELGAVGVVEEAAPGAATLRAFFPPGTDAASLAGDLRAYLGDLAALALPGAEARVGVAPLPDEPWADAWRAHFRPVPVGRRLLVCPPWEAPPAALAEGRTVVLIEPGRAFGTGGHGSTRSCLELLERALAGAPVSHALDVGCGSGILAIAAARLGVSRVDAIDVDPDAVAATEENAERNAVADRVRASVAAADAWEGPPAPLVLANLLAATHAALAPALTARVTPGGSLIAGGLLAHEAPVVTGTFAAEGCWLVELVESDGWAALLLRRGG